MEAKLKEYRAIRRRKELIESAKEKYEKSKEKLVNFLIPKVIQDMNRPDDDDDSYDGNDEKALLKENEDPPKYRPNTLPGHPIQPIEDITDMTSEASDVESIFNYEEGQEPWVLFLIRWFVYTVIWMGFWAFFVYIQFGAVYFVITVFLGIYFNTRTRPKKKGEVSAYSVFNENCASIKGTLTPEQFEREIRFGPGTIRNY